MVRSYLQTTLSAIAAPPNMERPAADTRGGKAGARRRQPPDYHQAAIRDPPAATEPLSNPSRLR
jgi:hypothetical protein